MSKIRRKESKNISFYQIFRHLFTHYIYLSSELVWSLLGACLDFPAEALIV
jgi:hypothetical protein